MRAVAAPENGLGECFIRVAMAFARRLLTPCDPLPWQVLSVEDAYKDFFDIAYTFPGAMSAGMSCTLTVTFDPRLNDDIDTSIPCLGETGPFSIPLKVRLPQCLLLCHRLSLIVSPTVCLPRRVSHRVSDCVSPCGPLKARIKRRVISLLPNSGVYFGLVTLAESRTATLTLVNEGALRADFTIDITNTPTEYAPPSPRPTSQLHNSSTN